jgi:hypothetical protein
MLSGLKTGSVPLFFQRSAWLTVTQTAKNPRFSCGHRRGIRELLAPGTALASLPIVGKNIIERQLESSPMSTLIPTSGPALHRHRHGIVLLLCSAFAAALYLNAESTLTGAPYFLRIFDGHPTGRAAFRSQALHAADHATAKDPANDELLARNTAELERGYSRLRSAQTYTATFRKQERIDGELLEEQVMDVKLRHSPFSVYMKWTEGEVGREMLYVDGEHDGKMVVHAGGLRGRIIPAVKLDPESSLSMSESRYPVTKAGLLNLTREVIEYRKQNLANGHDVRCEQLADEEIAGRTCHRYLITWNNQSESPTYRKSIHCLDKESSLLVAIQSYGWPEDESVSPESLDEATLIEHYCYSNVQLGEALAASEFDTSNEGYNFRR